jgi:RNA polymerase sigma factor (TIGR02999 family)
VHEAFLHLVDVDIDWQDRAHFFAVASRLMRRLLIDRARARLSKKRGGGQLVDVDLEQIDDGGAEQELLELDSALNKLKELDERKANVLEQYFFGGLSYAEIGAALGISEATVDRDLRFAKAWVYNEIHQ